VNDGGGFGGAEPGGDDDTVGKPGEFGRDVTTSVALGNDETCRRSSGGSPNLPAFGSKVHQMLGKS
jgi:hypothetical protein